MNTGNLPLDWDKQLKALGGSILQSQPWADLEQSLGRQLIWDQGEGWMWAGFIRESRGLRYLMCSYGPSAKSAATMKEAVTSLTAAGRSASVDFVRLDPQTHISAAELRGLGAIKIAEVQPQHTQVVDLTLSDAELRANLTSGHRNLINGTERRGITIKQGDQSDMPVFIDMLHQTAHRAGASFHSDNYYQKLWDRLGKSGVAKLYVGSVEGEPVAAAMFYDWGHTRYYAHAGAFQEQNRKHKVAVSLVWQALLDAKQAGLKAFDLWGVAPVGAVNHPWGGITQFKTNFGGAPVAYVGTWDIPLKSAKYKLYGLYRKLRGRS